MSRLGVPFLVFMIWFNEVMLSDFSFSWFLTLSDQIGAHDSFLLCKSVVTGDFLLFAKIIFSYYVSDGIFQRLMSNLVINKGLFLYFPLSTIWNMDI